jgi:hypothetical protein
MGWGGEGATRTRSASAADRRDAMSVIRRAAPVVQEDERQSCPVFDMEGQAIRCDLHDQSAFSEAGRWSALAAAQPLQSQRLSRLVAAHQLISESKIDHLN